MWETCFYDFGTYGLPESAPSAKINAQVSFHGRIRADMKILYKQPENEEKSILSMLGIQRCFLKNLRMDRDFRIVTKKEHHHTGYEVHFIVEGYQAYEVDGVEHMLCGGDFLVLPPHIPHTFTSSAPQSQKYSLTFELQSSKDRYVYQDKIPARMLENMKYVSQEAAQRKELSQMLIENSILEIVVSLLRILGELKEREQTQKDEEDAVIALAKQYIKDNVEWAPKVGDVAEYCYLSTKHFTRIFVAQQGVTPGEYIRTLRIKAIERLLVESNLSLKQISEKMSFPNEYYFNAFFKKHAGMPPGEYRKMMGFF